MQTGLLLAGLAAGLAGGPHCVGMCGAALCGATQACGASAQASRFNGLLLGRALGYAAAGALVASVSGALQWGGAKSSALHPVWTLVEAASLVLGFSLLLRARQPLWLEQAGQRLWHRLGPATQRIGQSAGLPASVRPVVLGLFWVALPCGLLYSALMLAALSNSALGGAGVMAAFAAGSSASLLFWQQLWRMLTRYRGSPRELQGAWGMRIAGLALILSAGWALGHGLWQAWQAACGPVAVSGALASV